MKKTKFQELESANRILDLNSKKIHKLLLQLEDANSQIEAAATQKELFLANISHEIRTPINAILGFTELMIQDKNHNLSAEQLQNLEIINNASFQLTQIVNQFLSFTKLQHERFTLVEASYNLNSFCKHIEDTFSFFAKQHKVQFEAVYDQNHHVNLIGDFVKIEQIISNLLTNSFKFSQEGKVTFKIESLLLNPQEVELCITIKDNGCGISKKDIQTIFNDFKQVDSHFPNPNSYGLGLSICKSLTELLNGELNVKSTVNKGSTFTVKIKQKIDNKSLNIAETDIQKEYNFNIKNILIADDNSANRMYLAEILNQFKIPNVAVSSGLEVLDLIKKHHFDFLLLDWKMPGIHGEKLIKRIKKENSVNSKIVIISANTSLIPQELIIELDSVLSKPFTIEDLKRVLHPTDSQIKLIKSSKFDLKNDDLDSSYLDAIVGENTDFKKQLISIFTTEFPQEIKEIQEFIKKRKTSHLNSLAHKMLSSAKLFGLHNVVSFLEQLEQINSSDLKISLEKLSSKIQKLENEVLDFIKKINQELK